MATLYTSDEELTSVANHIRAKTGLSASLVWPTGFNNAIDNFVVTDDATASASDILNGKTAYVSGSKITGNIAFKTATNLTVDGLKVTVPSGYYSSQISKTLSDANLIASNIRQNTTVFGVTGTLEETQGLWAVFNTTTVPTSLFSYSNSTASVKKSIFTSAHSRITAVGGKKITSIGSYAFYGIPSLSTASFPICTSISNYAFNKCFRLISLNLSQTSTVCTLGTYVFSSTPIGGYSTSAGQYGSVYVPASLLTSYKTATNWTAISNRLVGV